MTFPYELSEHAQESISKRSISLEWVQRTLEQPDRIDPHKRDGQLKHALKRIPEYEGRVLRVVYNFTMDPWRIVTVHFDRRFRDSL